MRTFVSLIALCGAVAAGGFYEPAAAKQGPEAIAKLGNELTPIGAERAGNADGTIPEWTGGITEPPAGLGYEVGDHHPDPFGDDDIVLTITSENYQQYADKLTAGHVAMFERYPDTYKMNIYPTHRSCAFPEDVYAAVKKNAADGELADNGNGVVGATMSTPFPLPTEGVEVIWNHNLRYRGYKVKRRFANLATTSSGGFTPVKVEDQAIFFYSNPALKNFEDLNNISLKYLQRVVEPARRAGQVILVHESINQAAGPRLAWQYSPGTRRVRRAPTIAFDNPESYSDGLATSDNFDVFNGSPERYTWDLKGKTEKYIPYNTYRIASDEVSYSDIARAGHINQDLMRYELHRVWVVEAALRPEARHIYARRVNYSDEDSWNIVATELYDSRGGLWRVQEGHVINFYELPTCYNTSEVTFDLVAGRYSIQGLANEEYKIDFFAEELQDEDFNPDALRRLGVR